MIRFSIEVHQNVYLASGETEMNALVRVRSTTGPAEAMCQAVGEASLRLWIPFGARVLFFKQVYPTINDLSGRAARVDPNTLAYPTGAWGTEERHYHLGIGDLKPIAAEKPSRVGAVRFVLDGEKSDGAVILARWTDDWMLFTQTSRAEAAAAGQAELALAIELGTAALRDGDEEDAARHLGRAARIAFEADDRAKLDLLARLVEIEDAAAGVVRARPGLGRGLVEGASLLSRWTRNVESSSSSSYEPASEPEAGAYVGGPDALGGWGGVSGRVPGGDADAAAGEPVRVHVRAQCDPRVRRGEMFTVSVVLSREQLRRAAALSDVGQAVEAEPEEELVVEVLGRAQVETVRSDRRVVPVPGAGSPRVALFDVRASHAGQGELWVIVSQRQVPLCTMVLLISIVGPVEDQVSDGPDTGAAADGTGGTGGTGGTAAVGEASVEVGPGGGPALHMLRVFEERQGDRVVYRYDLQAPDLELLAAYASKPVHQDRDRYVRSIYQRVEAGWNTAERDSERFHEELRALGGELLDELVPTELRDLLWEYRDRLHNIIVLSTEPFIPWELLHLKAPGSKQLPAETCFLAQLGLVRWRWTGWPPRLLMLRPGRARYLIPDYPDANYRLPFVIDERRYLRENVGATRVEPHFHEVRDLLRNTDIDLLHFAGHAVASAEDISDAHLLLEGRREPGPRPGDRDRYAPEPLRVSVVAQNLTTAPGARPIVVVNACQAGRLGHQLSSIGGFAEAFIGGGAAVFVSSLWSVGDAPAATFITTFYDWLRGGSTLAEATVAGREAARAHGDTTWLAYTVYGHPEARLGPPSA